MLKFLCCLYLCCICAWGHSQDISLNPINWQFRQAGTVRWNQAVVPGSVYTDLHRNKIINDPFFSDNEKELKWIDSSDWEYRNKFIVRAGDLTGQQFYLQLEGLDTYADVYLNNRHVLRTDNMFRSRIVEIRLRPGENEVRIYFRSAVKYADSVAKARLPLVLPDHPRVYSRKAQYQFGWDWGPAYSGAGIWKNISIINGNEITALQEQPALKTAQTSVRLVQDKDSIGTSFYFTKNGRPIYIKGANWIPASIFPAAVRKDDYRQLLLMAKDAGMNMLRVWGGGLYESDDFYQLCDSLDIMVWQDFMFAGAMYPGDEDFFANVKEEVKEQVKRLQKYSCIVLWCGNNEIDEAWHHWGWQKQFNLQAADSARIWKNYRTLFHDSLKSWTSKFDNSQRAYVSTSPQYGWGNPMSYKNGDSHYWGLWWGLEPWEKFKTHTGRFVSEWGMQAMPDYSTVKKYTPVNQRYLYSPAVVAHQKANEGFKKLNHYLHRYFIDSSKLRDLSLFEYTYLTQCLQYYILKNSIATHMSKQPVNMGTLIWQLNDCWPVTSWSIIDYFKKPKAGYYAVKKAYHSMDTATNQGYPISAIHHKANIKITELTNNSITVLTDLAASYVCIYPGDIDGYLSDNYFNLSAGEKRTIQFNGKANLLQHAANIKVISLSDVLLK